MASPEGLTVLVDMDGVMADFDGGMTSHLRDNYPEIPILDRRQHFYFIDDYPEYAEIIRSIEEEPGLFESLPVIDHALEGWQRVIDLGFHGRVCSRPLARNSACVAEKINWLRRELVREFGEYVVEEAIFTAQKYLPDAVANFDDQPKIKLAELASWQHIIFDQQYNDGVPGVRLFGWLDQDLPELLDNATDRYFRFPEQKKH
jgi:5'-nucleotidase